MRNAETWPTSGQVGESAAAFQFEFAGWVQSLSARERLNRRSRGTGDRVGRGVHDAGNGNTHRRWPRGRTRRELYPAKRDATAVNCEVPTPSSRSRPPRHTIRGVGDRDRPHRQCPRSCQEATPRWSPIRGADLAAPNCSNRDPADRWRSIPYRLPSTCLSSWATGTDGGRTC